MLVADVKCEKRLRRRRRLLLSIDGAGVEQARLAGVFQDAVGERAVETTLAASVAGGATAGLLDGEQQYVLIAVGCEGDELLEEAIRAAIAHKPKGHDFDYSRQKVAGQVSRHMSHTGG